MSDVTPPEPTLPEPPRRDPWTVLSATTSVILHGVVLVFLLWQPPPASAEATPPVAVDVELVPPPETVSPTEPPVEKPEKKPEEGPEDVPETGSKDEVAATKASPAKATPPEPPPAQQSAPPPPPAAEQSQPETPSETTPPEPAAEPATAASGPAGSVKSSAEAPPIPLSRPRVRGLSAPATAPDAGAAELTADTGEGEEGAAAPAQSAEPDVATLVLGEQRIAERFYLEAMLSNPGMARAREMIETLPPEKRLAQTCNIEALAQVGNAGEGYSPDVVMAEAYARVEAAGTHLAANGAIFRSEDKWYGLAFDCTLSDDLTSVTAFSYRLGADVTDAVLARLGRT